MEKKESIWQKDIKDLFKINRYKKENEEVKKNRKQRVTIDINEDTIDILVGTKEEIVSWKKLKTPSDAFENGFITDVVKIGETIKEYFKMAHIRAKDIYFIVHGDDIITRYLELPILGDKAMDTAVKIEIRKSYPDKESLYYYSYQLTESVNEEKASIGKYMVVMCKRSKIDKYVELSEILKLNLKCIDLSSNSLKRVISSSKYTKNLNYIGILSIQNNETTLAIINDNLLQMEKRINFGVSNIKRILELNDKEVKEKLRNIDFNSIKPLDYEGEQVKGLVDTLSTVLNGVIKFYFSGRAENNLNRMYVLGDLNHIKGIKNYFENYFENEIVFIDDLNINIDKENIVNLIDYVNCYGLLLRED